MIKEEQLDQADTASLWYLIAGASVSFFVITGLNAIFPHAGVNLVETAIAAGCAFGLFVTYSKKKGYWTFEWPTVLGAFKPFAIAGAVIFLIAIVLRMAHVVPSDVARVFMSIGFFSAMSGGIVPPASAIIFKAHQSMRRKGGSV